jgi:hypothetical protein
VGGLIQCGIRDFNPTSILPLKGEEVKFKKFSLIPSLGKESKHKMDTIGYFSIQGKAILSNQDDIFINIS